MRVFGSSKEFLELLFPNGAKLLLDGAIQVRTHAKHMFGELMRHEKFESMTKEYLRENERRDIKKTLDSIKWTNIIVEYIENCEDSLFITMKEYCGDKN